MSAWVAILTSGLLQAIVSAFFYGRLTERVAGQGDRLKRLEDTHDSWAERRARVRHQGIVGAND